MERTELVLHPVRLRVILAVANRSLTTRQIADLLPDVAQATLYRQIGVLLEHGVLHTVSEVQVRGATERTLTLAKDFGRIDTDDFAALPPDEQQRYFINLIGILLADFQRASERPLPNGLIATYTRQRLYLSPDELDAVNAQTNAVLAPYRQPSRMSDDPHVQPWLFTGIVMPDTDLPAQPDSQETPS
ncbi:MAG: helix-turn-helix domain-containing protein [Anaerolineae bacterium]|jgi:hypothetical protein|nr:helix-turn-helix domain-containing protein [Anaerolineae bacterium]